MQTMRIRFTEAEGGHEGLINACDFNPSRHISIEPEQPKDSGDKAPALRDDGPTLEVFVEAGYLPENYPPAGYAEKPSPGLEAFRAEQAKAKAGSTENTKEPGPLDGNLASVKAHVESIKDVAELDALEAAEKAGKTRKGVLTAIDERREALKAS